MVRSSFLWFVALAALSATVCVAKDPLHQDLFKPPKFVLTGFPLTAVDISTVSHSRPGVNHLSMQNYLLWLDQNRLLYWFRQVAGLPTNGYQPYGGWESASNSDRGHFSGHYLSALAQMFAATNDTRFANKAKSFVNAIHDCQAAIGTGYVSSTPHWFFDDMFAFVEQGYFCDPAHAYDYPNGVPFYVSHKLLAGLLDWYKYTDDVASAKQALHIARGLSDHFDSLVTACIQTNTTWMWNVVMNLEFGGMAESLHHLYNITKDYRYYNLAVWFEKPCFVGPLAQQHEIVTGLHGNTHVPQVIGDALRYEIDGNHESYIITSYFWDVITQTRSYATSGNTNWEHWQTPNQLAQELSTSNQETCVSYNMLKLSWHLLQWTGDSKYADFAHRLFWNGLMGTIDPQGIGILLYYTPLAAGSQKNFGSPDNSFWCCYGTGIENWSGLGAYIYYSDAGNNVYVHNFMESSVTVAPGVTLQQSTYFPDTINTTFTFQYTATAKPFNGSLNVLVPSWISGPPSIWINGKLLALSAAAGQWVTVPPQGAYWNYNTQIELQFPMDLYTVSMPDLGSMVAVLYGPVVLVGLTTDNCLGIDARQHPPSTWLKRTTPAGGPLRFDTFGSLVPPIRFMPLSEITDMVYTVYFNSCAPQATLPPQPPIGTIPAFKGDCKLCKSRNPNSSPPVTLLV